MTPACAWVRHHGGVRGWEFTSCTLLSAAEREMIKTLITGQGDLCRKCGAPGHFAAACRAHGPVAPWLCNLMRGAGPPRRKTVRKHRDDRVGGKRKDYFWVIDPLKDRGYQQQSVLDFSDVYVLGINSIFVRPEGAPLNTPWKSCCPCPGPSLV